MTDPHPYPLWVNYTYLPRTVGFPLPPLPPDGWPVPRIGDTIRIPLPGQDFAAFATVIAVTWDYSIPSVTVYLSETLAFGEPK